jgi:hypothetical protein
MRSTCGMGQLQGQLPLHEAGYLTAQRGSTVLLRGVQLLLSLSKLRHGFVRSAARVLSLLSRCSTLLVGVGMQLQLSLRDSVQGSLLCRSQATELGSRHSTC